MHSLHPTVEPTGSIHRRSQGRASAAALSRTWLLILVGVLSLASVGFSSAALAQSDRRADSEEPDESEPLFEVQRIELRPFFSLVGGDGYLELPAVRNDLTSDTAADRILDFSGNPAQSIGLSEAPGKEIQGGWTAGGQASFYLSESFGMFLRGSVGRADAVLTGQRDPDAPREEFDRASVTTFALAGGGIFHLGRARKLPIRPYVNLAFGGLLNQFADVDDVSALFFTGGGGVTFPLTGSFRGQFGLDMILYSWDTDEVSLDRTLLLPQASVGIVWNYDVPRATN